MLNKWRDQNIVKGTELVQIKGLISRRMIKEREKKHRINFCRSHRHPPAGRLRPTRAVGARVAGGAPGTEAASGPASRGAPQINQKLPGAGRTRTRAAPALRHSMARRRVVLGSRRVAGLPWPDGRSAARLSVPPQTGTSIPSASPIHHVRHPSRLSPVAVPPHLPSAPSISGAS